MTHDPLDEVFKDQPPLMTVEHIANLTHLTPRTIRSKLASEEIPGGKRIGRSRWLVPRACVRSWYEDAHHDDTPEH